MKINQLFKTLYIAIVFVIFSVAETQAQNAAEINNSENENVEINNQESGSQQQGQSADGGSSEVNFTDEDESDNFWSNSYRGRLSIPPGSASLTCGEQMISFSRSGGFGFGVGAAGINFGDNTGAIPNEFNLNLTAIQQCAREKNIAEILGKYVELLSKDKAIANTYLRAVSPEIYATFFIENAKSNGEIFSEKSLANLTDNLRNKDFNQIIEWQDNFYSAGLAEARLKLKQQQDLNSVERDKQIAELEILELKRKAKEAAAILRYRQSRLDNSLQQYQQPK